MDWTNQTVMKFLELYQMHPCIWNPKNSSHKNKNKVNDAWIDIQNNMDEPCTVMELKKKKESLMSAFRGYRTKIKKSETSGSGTSDLYQPTWFAYEFMNSFLGAIYKCNPSINTEAYHNQQEVDNSTNQDDKDDTDTVGKTDTSHSAEGYPSREARGKSMSQNSSSSQQTSTAKTSRKRNHNPPELQQAKSQMDQAFNILKNVAQPRHNDEENECSIFGKLVAQKIRKLSEDRRDLMMIQISNIFYEERQEHNRPNSSSPVVPYVHYTPSPTGSMPLASPSYSDTEMPESSLQVTYQHEEEESLLCDNSSEDLNSEVDPTALQQSHNVIPMYIQGSR